MKLRTLIILFVLVSTLFPGVETRKIKKRGTGSKDETVEEKKDSSSPKKDLASPKKDSVKPNKQDVEPKKEEKVSQTAKKSSKIMMKNKPNLKIDGSSNDNDVKQEQTQKMSDDEIFMAKTQTKLVEKIGGGSFGSVWKAEDHEHNEVAVKTVKLNHKNVAEHEKKILEDVKGIKYITQMKEFWHFGNTEYYVFDLYEGSLDSYPHFEKKGTSLDWKKTLKQILETLAEMHDRGIMHLDIKPHNIMIKGQDVFIGDFGIAQRINEIKSTEAGTEEFKAPEQIAGKPERKSDIWALGNTLLWLYTKTTFNSIFKKRDPKASFEMRMINLIDNNSEETESILKEMLASIKEQLKEIKMDEKDFDLLSKLLRKMMIANPEHRPSAKELLDELYKH